MSLGFKIEKLSDIPAGACQIDVPDEGHAVGEEHTVLGRHVEDVHHLGHRPDTPVGHQQPPVLAHHTLPHGRREHYKYRVKAGDSGSFLLSGRLSYERGSISSWGQHYVPWLHSQF